MTWFREFVRQHTARHPHSQWPAPGEDPFEAESELEVA